MANSVDLQKQNQQLSFNQVWLEHCLNVELVSLRYEDENSDLNRFWIQIDLDLKSNLSSLSLDNPECFAMSSRAFKKAKRMVKVFKLKYQNSLSIDNLEDIELSLNHLEFNKKKSNSLNILFKELSKSIDLKDRIKSYLKYLDNVLEIALPFLLGRKFETQFIASIIKYFDYLLSNIYIILNSEELDLNTIEKINLRSNNLFIFISHLRNIVKEKYPDFPNDLIQVSDHGKIIYINSNSAESRAIQRLESINSGEEVKWNLHVKSSEMESEEDLDRWLSANGYL